MSNESAGKKVVDSVRTSHLRRNPKKGGNPAKERRLSEEIIYSEYLSAVCFKRLKRVALNDKITGKRTTIYKIRTKQTRSKENIEAINSHPI
jgi:hypothetical protein